MALDKLVDSAQLDSDLASVANAIRTKGGTSADLAFPVDFISAIGNIPSGGGTSVASGTYTASVQTNVNTIQFETGIDFDHFVIAAEQNPYGDTGTFTIGGCFFDNTMTSKKTMLWISSNSGGTLPTGGVLNNYGTKNGTVFAMTGDRYAVLPAGITYRWYAW